MELWRFLRAEMQRNLKRKICENDAELTFEELLIFAEAFAKRLKWIHCCAIFCQSEMAAGMALLSCFAAGVTALPLSERYGEIHCNKILEAISPDAVITDRGGAFQIVRIADSRYVEPARKPALILCTSGTTGAPKGVMLTDENVVTNVSDIASYFGLGAQDTILISRPLYHCAVLTGEFLIGLVKGAKIRFYSKSFNPPVMPALIQKYGVTALGGTPTLFGLMSRFVRSKAELPLKRICISGECMSKELGLRIADAFPTADIYHVYGLTEACPRVAFLPPELFRKYPDCVGIPLRSVELRVVNAQGACAEPEEDGLLYVRGGSVMMGYYNDPEKTNAVLQEGWLCTGDIAAVNSAGLLKIKGRNDDLIIKAGMNIYPQEIESCLKADRRVREALAYGYHAFGSIQIGLKIAGDFAGPEEVKQLCAKILPPYQMPAKIELLPELARNESGKIKRGESNA